MTAQTPIALCLLGILVGCGASTPTAVPPPAPPPTTLPAATLADLSAAVLSPQSGRTVNCRDAVVAQVMLTNRGRGTTTVTGVRKSARVLSGGCTSAPDYTYDVLPVLVGPGETATVMNTPLYNSNGSGCCNKGGVCDGQVTCTIEETFTALATPGNVAAGSFSYDLNFLNCNQCGVTSTGRAVCGPSVQ
jgi:hypothetical protein